MGGGLLPRGPCRGAPVRRLAEPRPQVVVGGQAPNRVPQGVDVARRNEQALTSILGEVGQVAGSPAGNREAERHRFSPDRSVGLAERGQDERVGGRVEAGHALARQRAMCNDAPG